jgi:hypothetical protein
LLLQHAADGLDDIAVDLMLNAGGVDHQPGILADGDARQSDVAGARVDLDIRDPGRPGSGHAGELAMHVDRVGKATAS